MNPSPSDELERKVASLPRELPPRRDLWPSIQSRLSRKRLSPTLAFRLILLAASIAVAGLVFHLARKSRFPGWDVAVDSGVTRLNQKSLTAPARWKPGQWLETGPASAATVSIGQIGEARLGANSRLRLVDADPQNHRIELQRGSLQALIWAPPRIFFVDTPSATAIDLGCAYILNVDESGNGVLQVTSGYVALENMGRASLIPSGMTCRTRRDAPPGTPVSVSAAATLQSAVERVDAGTPRDTDIGEIASSATEDDAVTLWHLVPRIARPGRDAIVAKLEQGHPLPQGVTREGILAGNKTMLDRWGKDLGLSPMLEAKP